MAKNRIVEAESVFDFSQCLARALNVHEHIVGLDKLVNRISKLTTSPILNAVHFAALLENEVLVAFNHRRHLLGLIRVHDDTQFIMTHYSSLRKKPPERRHRCGKDLKEGDSIRVFTEIQAFFKGKAKIRAS